MAKVICPPTSGRVGDVVYVQSARFGQIVRKYSPPRNPRSSSQQANRGRFGAVSSRWRGLAAEQRAAWCLVAAGIYVVNSAGRQVSLSGYHYFMRVNASRAHLDLSLYELPPAVPSFPANPVDELSITRAGGVLSIKVRVSSQPAQYTLVQASAPVSAGVRCVQAYRYVGLLPAADNGWSDITDLVVGRHGLPTAGKMLFIRTRQQINGWMDVPRVLSALVPAG